MARHFWYDKGIVDQRMGYNGVSLWDAFARVSYSGNGYAPRESIPGALYIRGQGD
jgi:hypothetical protein